MSLMPSDYPIFHDFVALIFANVEGVAVSPTDDNQAESK